MNTENTEEKKKKKKPLLALFIAFAKIGTFAFGGGYVMVPMIQKEASETHDWVAKDKIGEVISISSSMPGAIAMNSSVYVGYIVGGFSGALAALMGCILPAIILAFCCTVFLSGFQSNSYVISALKGIVPVVTGLMLAAMYKLFKSNVKDYGSLIICGFSIVAGVILTIYKVNIIFVLLFSALIGLFFSLTSISLFAKKTFLKKEGTE